MNYDAIIIGGGAVGLATAYQLSSKRPDFKILVLEKEKKVASHQTGNNSGVIHSGLYYKPGSLKAKNCIRGYELLVDFCQKNDVPFELCGKIIVATEEAEMPSLHTLFERGKENGLQGLVWLKKEALKEHEPHVEGKAGIFVPQTGIVDFSKVAQKYAEKIQENGVELRLGEKVHQVLIKAGGVEVITSRQTFQGKLLINCAGLYSDKIARLTHPELDIRIIPFRGEYFTLKKEKEYLVKNLIYPVPDPNFPFLGVHFTRMAKGGVEAGPNAVLAFAREGYKKSQVQLGELFETLLWPGFRKVVSKYWKTGMGEMYRSYSKAAFTKALQKMLPSIQEEDLAPGGAGVRAQACDRNGGLLDDFMILEKKEVIHVCNAPSPAATSSLSIGETIAQMALSKVS